MVQMNSYMNQETLLHIIEKETTEEARQLLQDLLIQPAEFAEQAVGKLPIMGTIK